MTTERWRVIEEIYQAAADLEPAARAGFLEQACGSDAALRREVEGLLGASGDVDTAIEASIRLEAETLANRASESVVGKRIGLYRVTGAIGAGGMGTVYRALRDDDAFQKEVAIKVVKRGMHFDTLLARFRRERQILARLEHPNISRLLDGGVTGEALPYFVMEYVEGTPLMQYCADKPMEERLRLFRQVCAAVQYAHQNLIVHRDLKPANILVTKDGIPKLLDFGLAKLLDAEQLPEHTLTIVKMLTPDYASPEQVRGEAMTTASDIYSLGAVLYEIVSGERAHRFGSRTTAEMERVVCQTDPPPLAGELGNIVQMALRKEPERRYATVEQFSEDIRRYLNGLPVLARRDTIVYRSGKFLRRHRWGSAIAALAVVGLLSATIFAEQQRRSAERAKATAQAQARRADAARDGTMVEARRSEAARVEAIRQAKLAADALEQVRGLATTMLFDVNAKMANLPGSIEVRRTLVTTGLRYLDAAAGHAAGDPKVQWELARAYEKIGDLQGGPRINQPNIGDREGAARSYGIALRLAEPLRLLDPTNFEVSIFVARIQLYLGQLLDDPHQAISRFQASLRIATSLGAQRPAPRLARLARAGLANVHLQAGDPSTALTYLTTLEPKSGGQITKALALAASGDLPAALFQVRAAQEEAEQGIAGMRAGEGLGVRVVRRQIIYAHALKGRYLGSRFDLNLGDHAEAIQELKIAVATAEKNAARDTGDSVASGDLFFALVGLGHVLGEENPNESLSAYERAIELLKKLPPGALKQPGYRGVSIDARSGLAHTLRTLKRPDEALRWARESLEIEETARGRLILGHLLLDSGDRSGALAEYRRALVVAEKAVVSMPRLMPLRRDLADCYESIGEFHAAAKEWREARGWYGRSLGVWQDWTKWGVSSPFDQRRREEAEAAVSRFGRLLLTNSPE